MPPDMFNRVLFLGFAIAFGGVVIALCRAVLFGRASNTWPVTSGRVLRSSVRVTRRLIFPVCTLQVHYSYSVAGTKYEGIRVVFGADSIDNVTLPTAAKQQLERYAPDTVVDVRYDPRNPSRAVLEPGVTTSTVVYTIAYFIACVCCVWLLLH